MSKIKNKLREIKEHHSERSLTKQALKEFADDPDVEFVYSNPNEENAPHGVNTSEEMKYSAEPIAD